jgi:hypothetical protein
MSKFEHWLDPSSEASEFERAVLRSGAEADPPEARRDEVWSRVLGSLSLTPLGAALSQGATVAPASAAIKAATSASKSGAVWLGVGKGFVVGLAVYGASTGIGQVATQFAPHRPSVTTSTLGSARAQPARNLGVPADVVPAAESGPEPKVTPAASSTAAARAPDKGLPGGDARDIRPALSNGSSVAAFDDAPGQPTRESARRASQLEAEARALRDARAALKAGELSNAFATLEAAQRNFSVPELDQEREALMIELLQRSGHSDAASQRARAFLKLYPNSPHAGQVRPFAAQP